MKRTANTRLNTLSYTTLFRSSRGCDQLVTGMSVGGTRNAIAGTSGGYVDDPSQSPAQPSRRDRKSTRLNFSHSQISYAVFCLKKKTTNKIYRTKHSP